jgi:hypothetical protein
MAYPETTYDVNTPDGSDNPTEGDDEIRLVKASIQERLNLEHVFDKTGSEVSGANTGKHTNITTLSIVNAGTLTQTGLATLQSLKLTDGVTVTKILDEDDLVSDSDVMLATQQSIKAYIDAAIAALVDFSGAVDIFGTRQKGLLGETTYLAPTDGFFIGWWDSTSSVSKAITCYASTNESLVTAEDSSVRVAAGGASNEGGNRECLEVPIKKGEYVRFAVANVTLADVQWLPIGVGELATP